MKNKMILFGLFLLGILIVNCKKEDNSTSSNYKSCSERADFGDPATSEYILPYSVGEAYELVQSYCTPNNSHRNQLAYDFLMPTRVNLIAVRDGIVRELVKDQPDSEPGGEPIGTHNHINIEHEDGSVSFYAHLKEQAVYVNVGDAVSIGDTIALSGNSGTSLPHLHFGVYRTWPAIEGDDLAVNFRNTDGSVDDLGGLIAGEIYEALPY